ncbi:hypothetical protein LRP88_05459 [Fusarium phalaenopsidis]
MSRDSSIGTIVPETEGSPDEQDAAPEDELEAYKDLAYEDNDVKESRHPDTPINNHNDLTRREKVTLMGLLAGYTVMYEGQEVEGGRGRPYREFFRLIFRDWSSEDGNGAPPEWRDHSNTPVLAPFVTETSDIPTKSKHRKASQPIYLSLTLNLEHEWYSWLWRDQGRQWVNPKHVTYNSGLNREEARIRILI